MKTEADHSSWGIKVKEALRLISLFSKAIVIINENNPGMIRHKTSHKLSAPLKRKLKCLQNLCVNLIRNIYFTNQFSSCLAALFGAKSRSIVSIKVTVKRDRRQNVRDKILLLSRKHFEDRKKCFTSLRCFNQITNGEIVDRRKRGSRVWFRDRISTSFIKWFRAIKGHLFVESYSIRIIYRNE